MNKLRWLLIPIVIGLLLLVGTMPAIADSPNPGTGTLEYIPTIVDSWVAGENTFMISAENCTYYGLLSGTMSDVGRVVIHTNGNWTYRAAGTFEGYVDGKYGTLEIRNQGSRPDASSEWQGTWVILSGTGELANLHGHGTFWGLGYTGTPTPDTPGVIEYYGEVHFDP